MAPARAAIRVIVPAPSTVAWPKPLSAMAGPKLENTPPPMAAVVRPAATMIQKAGSRTARAAVMPLDGARSGAVQRGGESGAPRAARPR